MFRHVPLQTAVVQLALALAAVTPSAASVPYAQDPPTAITSQTQSRPAVNPHSYDFANPVANPATGAIKAQAVRVARELAARDSLTASTPAPQVIKVSQPNGFDWGDAGIGAAGGLALAAFGVGGGLVISRRRGDRTRQTATVAN